MMSSNLDTRETIFDVDFSEICPFFVVKCVLDIKQHDKLALLSALCLKFFK